MEAGYSFQSYDEEDCHGRLTGFSEGQLSNFRVEGCPSVSLFPRELSPFVEQNASSNRVIAGFARVASQLTSKLSMSANIRREGSVRLGINNKWNTFYGLGLGYDIGSLIRMQEKDQLVFRTSYGKSGMVPTSSGWAADIFETIIGVDGQPIDVLTRSGNDDLTHEITKEINTGLTLKAGAVWATFDWYVRQNTGLVEFISIDFNQVSPIYFNSIDIRTAGIDLAVQVNLLESDRFRWDASFVGAHYSNQVTGMAGPARREGFSQPPFSTSVTHILAEEGSLGDFFGPILTEVSPDGSPVLQDINNDGEIRLPRLTGSITDVDAAVLGSGVPSWELGLQQSIRYQNWHMSMLLRGAFGHSLHNVYRAIHEPVSTLDMIRNSPIAKDGQNIQNVIEYSSAYIETADFLTVDNISLGYRFPVTLASKSSFVTATFTAQNVLTITNYSGFTPEPALVDRGDSFNGSFRSNNTPSLASAGNDHLTQYLPSSRFAFTLLFDL